jgi:nicotinate-nucleotide pyrophosphorylase (carboxylating)
VLIPMEMREIERVVTLALIEDAPWGDVTSQALVPEEAMASAELSAREAGVMSGGLVFEAAMRLTDASIQVTLLVEDGAAFGGSDVLATVNGSARSILQAERVALNFVQRMSGIATLTERFVGEVAATKARIVDTRKTTPGLRAFERYAVRCGGGRNHRYSLSDAVMAKDNHLAVLGVGVTEALRAARKVLPHTVHMEVEVDRLEQIEAVLAGGADTVMLDNFSLADLRAGVDQIAGRALVEASGGVRLDRVKLIAETGVDLISVGALTHSVRALDLGLDFAS